MDDDINETPFPGSFILETSTEKSDTDFPKGLDATYAQRLCAAHIKYHEARQALARILDEIIDPKIHDNYHGIHWDDYDTSLEIDNCPESVNFDTPDGPEKLQKNLGCGFL